MPCGCRSGLSGASGMSSKLIRCAWLSRYLGSFSQRQIRRWGDALVLSLTKGLELELLWRSCSVARSSACSRCWVMCCSRSGLRGSSASAPSVALATLALRHFFLRGTFAPERRASDRPIAIACLRLRTVFPERPLLSLPRFISCIARLTFRPLALPYLRATGFFLRCH
jgi:hypothetical protein